MSSKASDLAAATADAANRLIPTLTDELIKTATAAGWPGNIVQSLSVDFDGQDLYVRYPDSLADEIDDLEYGKPYGLPNPVIRPFAARCEDTIKDVIVQHTLDSIFEMEEVF